MRRSQLADLCGYGYSRSHSRWFWGMRLHHCCSLDGRPRAVMLCGADRKERDIALRQLLPLAASSGARLAALIYFSFASTVCISPWASALLASMRR